MQSQISNVGDRVKEFFQTLGRKKSLQKQRSQSQRPMSDAETPSSEFWASSSFRADDILRSNISIEENIVPSVFNAPPLKLPIDNEPPVMKSPNLPQIRPPAFSPLVNLKHMTPFEPSGRPLFRPRQLSAPPPSLDSKPARSPSPSPSVSSCSQPKAAARPQAPLPQVLRPNTTYIWDSWEKPAFEGAPGCISILTANEDKPANKQRQISPSHLPPPMLYYDPYSGQYVAASEYYTMGGRRSHATSQRHRPRRHQHHQYHNCNRSIGHYSTYNPNRSDSCMSDYASEAFRYPQVEQKLSEHTLNQTQLVKPRPMTLAKSMESHLTYQDNNNNNSKPKVQLVSSGTDDTPMQLVGTLSSRRQSNYMNNFHDLNANYVETITPVNIPITMEVVRRSISPVQPPQDQIRYTSDVVRSLNRNAFKISEQKSSNGILSPRDQYLVKVNGVSSRPEKISVADAVAMRTDKRPSVRDLVKKFLPSDDQSFTPQKRCPNQVKYSTKAHDSTVIDDDDDYHKQEERRSARFDAGSPNSYR